eukprot:4435483-Prymnesium_polylepis.3
MVCCFGKCRSCPDSGTCVLDALPLERPEGEARDAHPHARRPRLPKPNIHLKGQARSSSASG